MHRRPSPQSHSPIPADAPPRPAAKAGIDVLADEGFARLKGRKVGLITNHTGRAADGTPTIDLLAKAEGVKLVALFSPEHGIRGELDEKVGDSVDAKTGLPVYSLYGERRKPTAETLKGVDTLVYDIQDIGCRFYTYISTLGLVLEAAKEHGLKVVVLDRPNPIGGVAVEGPVRDAGRGSFVAYHELPLRHGLTVGELAALFNADRNLKVDLDVVRVTGWRRGDLYDRTGLTWRNPSPNMRHLAAALLYPGIGLLETTNVSVGRGTERPFEWIGAPWIDGQRLAAELAKKDTPGVRFVPVSRTPTYSTHKGVACGGVDIIPIDWSCGTPGPARAGDRDRAACPLPGEVADEELRPATGSQGDLRGSVGRDRARRPGTGMGVRPGGIPEAPRGDSAVPGVIDTFPKGSHGALPVSPLSRGPAGRARAVVAGRRASAEGRERHRRHARRVPLAGVVRRSG